MTTLEAGHVHAALILLDVDLTLGTSLAALTGLISPLLELSFTRQATGDQRVVAFSAVETKGNPTLLTRNPVGPASAGHHCATLSIWAESLSLVRGDLCRQRKLLKLFDQNIFLSGEESGDCALPHSTRAIGS
jgi:hypothetical protein